MSDPINLPSTSYSSLCKIIRAYGLSGENATLSHLSELATINQTTISGNNKFLSDIGLIEGGKKKQATELGIKLGRAIEYSRETDIRDAWQEAIRGNERIADLVSSVRINRTMSTEDFESHILYVSGQMNNKVNRTGAKTVAEILHVSGHLVEQDGKYTVSTPVLTDEEDKPSENRISEPDEVEDKDESIKDPNVRRTQSSGFSTVPQIAINIQLHLPETENPDVYENLFKALRQHLLDHNE